MCKFTVALFLTLLVTASNVSAKSNQVRAMALHLVQKIYVEDMGTSPEAVRFRMLLEDQLSEDGLMIVAKREEADAVLGGVVSLASPGEYGGPADISVTARLNAPDGSRLWSINTGGLITSFNPIASFKFKEPIEYRAKELARKLRHAREQSAKAAGVKVTK